MNNLHTNAPYGAFFVYYIRVENLNRSMTLKTQLTSDDLNLIQAVFASAAALDVDTKLEDDGDFTVEQFSQVWDKINTLEVN